MNYFCIVNLIKGRVRDIRGHQATISTQQGTLSGRARPWSLGLRLRLPWARSQARTGHGPRPRAGSPGLGPRVQGSGDRPLTVPY